MISYDTRDWFKVITQFHGTVAPRLLVRMFLAALIALGAAFLNAKTGFKLPPVIHTMVGIALGLLLVFRTNTSYDRFWEGRRLLGSIVNRSRDLMRQVMSSLEGEPEVVQQEQKGIQRDIVITYSLMVQHLRFEKDLNELKIALTPAEKQVLEPIGARPVFYMTHLTRRLAENLRQGRLTREAYWLMDGNITAIQDALGGCERILKTPIPFAYAQHIKSFLTIFCFTLPFVLVDSLGYYSSVAAAIIAYALFGIEEIGVEIEDPFGDDPNDLPMEAIGETIARDTAQMLLLNQ